MHIKNKSEEPSRLLEKSIYRRKGQGQDGPRGEVLEVEVVTRGRLFRAFFSWITLPSFLFLPMVTPGWCSHVSAHFYCLRPPLPREVFFYFLLTQWGGEGGRRPALLSL